MIIQVLAVIGFLIASYTLYVRHKLKAGDYKPVCDISETISCSRAIESEYATTLILPNALLGLGYYAVTFILAFINLRFVFYLAIPSVLFTIYLMYISFKMKNACLVCIATYIVNFLILFYSY